MMLIILSVVKASPNLTLEIEMGKTNPSRPVSSFIA